MRDFLQEVKSSLFEESTTMPLADITRQMAISKGPDEYLRPVNVGLMFFNKEPHKFFQRAWIEVVIRKDEAGKDFNEKYFKGPLQIQLRDALGYIRSNIIEERVKSCPAVPKRIVITTFPMMHWKKPWPMPCTTNATNWPNPSRCRYGQTV